MIGIYQDSFLTFLNNNLGGKIKITSKNIICKCPWCEFDEDNKKHYHLYISLHAPIFKCFHADCLKKGTITKLINKLSNTDLTDEFVDKSKIQTTEFNNQSVKIENNKEFFYPEINENEFKYKTFYLKKRLRFSNLSFKNIRHLIFDFNKFVEINKIHLDEATLRLKNYLQSNFIGFGSEHNSIITFRNIDPHSNFLHYKFKAQETIYPDYYKLTAGNINTNKIILCEGIFDILSEYAFNVSKLKNQASMYVACLSSNYEMILKSLVFYENKYRIDASILSDRDINLFFYKKLKKENSHILDKLEVYYGNKKDFGDVPDSFQKFII